MCTRYLRRNSNVRVDMTVQTRKLDGALRDEFIQTRRAQVRDFVHIYIDFRYAGVSTAWRLEFGVWMEFAMLWRRGGRRCPWAGSRIVSAPDPHVTPSRKSLS